MIKTLFGILKRSWTCHFWINLSTTGVLALSFGIIFGGLLLSQNISNVFALWGEDIQLSVYLKDGITDGMIENIKGQVQSQEAVASFKYLDKAAAAAMFDKSLKNYGAQFLSSLKNEIENPFPASFQIQIKQKFRKPAQIEELASVLQKSPGVEEVSFGQEWVKNYTLLARYGYLIGIIGGIAIVISCVLVVGNSVRASLQSRKEEIEILELVGATPGMVRVPFLIEGGFQALAACLGALAVLLIVYNSSFTFLEGLLGSGSMLGVLHFFSGPLILFLVFTSLLIGALGSYICVARINTGWASASDLK